MGLKRRYLSIVNRLWPIPVIVVAVVFMWHYREAILDWIAAHAAYSGLIVFIISCLESLALVGILVPGMALMLGVGTLVGLGVIPFWSTILWATLGAIVGDGISYWLGRHYNQVLKHLWPLTRYPNLVPQGEQFFQKHGELSVLFGRFVGPLRAIVPAVAGMLGMSAPRFYLMNILSAIAWSPVVVIPGAVFGASTQLASDVTMRLLLIVFSVLLAGWFFVWLFHNVLRLIVHSLPVRVQTHSKLVFSSCYMLLIFLLFVTPVIILTEKSAEIPEKFKQNQWWQREWLTLAQHNPGFNIQYLGDLTALQELAVKRHWYYPQPLRVNNLLRWLAPNAVLQDLPVYLGDLDDANNGWVVASIAIDDSTYGQASKDSRSRRLENDVNNTNAIDSVPASGNSGDQSDSEYTDNGDNKSRTKNSANSVYILSIRIKQQDIDAGRCLGLGRVQKLTYRPLFFGLGWPEVSLQRKFPESLLSDIKSVQKLEMVVRQHNQSDILLIRGREATGCDINDY